MTTLSTSFAENDHVGPAVDAVTRRAHFVADVVAHTIVAICDKAGIGKESARSCPLPAGFLLELGAVVQLWLWERAGLNAHIEAGLPSSKEAGQALERRAKLGAAEFDESRVDLWRRVNAFWIEHLAWDGQALLGAEITIDRGDDDSFVEEMAQFLWRNRGALSDPSDRQDSKP